MKEKDARTVDQAMAILKQDGNPTECLWEAVVRLAKERDRAVAVSAKHALARVSLEEERDLAREHRNDALTHVARLSVRLTEVLGERERSVNPSPGRAYDAVAAAWSAVCRAEEAIRYDSDEPAVSVAWERYYDAVAVMNGALYRLREVLEENPPLPLAPDEGITRDPDPRYPER